MKHMEKNSHEKLGEIRLGTYNIPLSTEMPGLLKTPTWSSPSYYPGSAAGPFWVLNSSVES